MNIYKFIDSRDIRKHLKNIGYKFNSFECAYLVWLSEQSIEAKHNAYNEIIETMPDMPLTENMLHCAGKNYTLHPYLKKLMKIEDGLIEELKEPDDFYYYSVKWGDKWFDSSDYFGDYEQCIADFRKRYEEDGVKIFRIRKTRPLLKREEKSPMIEIMYSLEKDIIYIKQSDVLNDMESKLFCLFEEAWLELPTPFKEGDLLCETFKPEPFDPPTDIPFVVKRLSTWESEERKTELKKQHDIWGMMSHGYYLNHVGQIEYDVRMINYLNLEYYRGELKGKKRLLKALSNFIKGEIDISLLLRSHEIILREADFEAAKAYLLYSDEDLELAALGKEYKES